MNLNENWIDLLTENRSDKRVEFYCQTQDSISLSLAVMKYRRVLMNKGRGQDITLEELQNANSTELQELLQEMFLELVSEEDIKYFYESATRRGYKNTTDAIEELYKRHKEDKDARFISIALTI